MDELLTISSELSFDFDPLWIFVNFVYFSLVILFDEYGRLLRLFSPSSSTEFIWFFACEWFYRELCYLLKNVRTLQKNNMYETN